MRYVSLTLLSILSLSLGAQTVPTTINYQGRLTDNTPSQTPLNATLQMQFAIYDAASGGARLWQEPAANNSGSSVAVTGGIFNYILGNTVAIPATVFSGATSVRYLQITLNPAAGAEILAPRQLIGATGYAALAENSNSALNANNATTAVYAGNLGGLPASSWQQKLASASCPANQYLVTVNADGTTACSAATGFTGSLAGNVTGTQSATVVAFVGSQSAANVAAGTALANAATNLNTASAIVKRDASGNFSAGTITASLNGNATSASTVAAPLTLSGTSAGGIISGTNNGAGDGVYGANNGTGQAGSFQINNAANTRSSLFAFTNGTGSAGDFEIVNAGNSSAALYAITNGTGPAGAFVGKVTISGKATSASTIAGDPGATLTTKDYVDGKQATRSVSLPLGSFQDITAQAAIPWVDGVDAKPDFGIVNGSITIIYDATAGSVDADLIGTTFTVPADYVSGGSFRVLVSEPTVTAVNLESISCTVGINGAVHGAAGATNLASSSATQTLTVTPAGTYAASAFVGVSCRQGNAAADDNVLIRGITFEYTASE